MSLFFVVDKHKISPLTVSVWKETQSVNNNGNCSGKKMLVIMCKKTLTAAAAAAAAHKQMAVRVPYPCLGVSSCHKKNGKNIFVIVCKKNILKIVCILFLKIVVKVDYVREQQQHQQQHKRRLQLQR